MNTASIQNMSLKSMDFCHRFESKNNEENQMKCVKHLLELEFISVKPLSISNRVFCYGAKFEVAEC